MEKNCKTKIYKPLPDYLAIGPSDIHGAGIIAQDDIPAEIDMGISHVYDPNFQHDYIRTPLGGFINHSENPNCYISTDKGDRTLHTVIPVAKGEELTVYYRFKGYDGIVGDDTTPGNLQE